MRPECYGFCDVESRTRDTATLVEIGITIMKRKDPTSAGNSRIGNDRCDGILPIAEGMRS